MYYISFSTIQSISYWLLLQRRLKTYISLGPRCQISTRLAGRPSSDGNEEILEDVPDLAPHSGASMTYSNGVEIRKHIQQKCRHWEGGPRADSRLPDRDLCDALIVHATSRPLLAVSEVDMRSIEFEC